MVKVNYKYVGFGEKFTFEGQEYTKTSHGRGYYYKEGKVIHRNFKKKTVVDAKLNLWDVVPKVK